MQKFWSLFQKQTLLVDDFLENYFSKNNRLTNNSVSQLCESMNYTLLNGGKRFRPVISILTAEALGLDVKKVIPFAAAIEMIHTYSLIHDDLPSMDNDEIRRGKKSNHLVFGEDIALLAGDALQAEAFHCISFSYYNEPSIATKLNLMLSKAIGFQGMVAGQIIDIEFAKRQKEDLNELILLHNLKTGALISAAVEGVSIIANAAPEIQKSLSDYGKYLGLAFQLADDILDYKIDEPEKQNFVTIIGHEETLNKLKTTVKNANNSLEIIGEKGESLKLIAEFVLKQVVEKD
jgi:geranylgeranyl diphosphate synthase type II